MFFRVLSAMVTADAIDRHARRRQHQQLGGPGRLRTAEPDGDCGVA
jgi:hypothetical protein